jgi:hypothetical protein
MFPKKKMLSENEDEKRSVFTQRLRALYGPGTKKAWRKARKKVHPTWSDPQHPTIPSSDMVGASQSSFQGCHCFHGDQSFSQRGRATSKTSTKATRLGQRSPSPRKIWSTTVHRAILYISVIFLGYCFVVRFIFFKLKKTRCFELLIPSTIKTSCFYLLELT